MKQHNPNRTDEEVRIKQVGNGYIVTCKNTAYQIEETVYHSFDSVIAKVAWELGLTGVGEDISVVSVKKGDSEGRI